MNGNPKIRRASTKAQDPFVIAGELHDALAQSALCLVVVFISSDLDVAAVAAALNSAFTPVPVVGCTTAGEIGPDGYADGTVSGFSLAAPDFAVAPVLIRDVRSFSVMQGQAVLHKALQTVWLHHPHICRKSMFAFTLIDGLCGCEEAVVSGLHAVLGEISLCGGSAGDCLRFERTQIIYGGRTYAGCALFVLVASRLPFRVFKTEHFSAGEERMVITEADPAWRRVAEINAEPAGREYARIVGLDPNCLTPMMFASHPVVVRVGGANFVRSIQKVNIDGSLTFYCAIDEGLVLTVGMAGDLSEDLERLFGSLRQELGPLALVLGFDCILRRLEVRKRGLRERIGRMMVENNVVGFATYGEQFQSMHVNQTFAGVAIGAARKGD